jgi:hypothetical protein
MARQNAKRQGDRPQEAPAAEAPGAPAEQPVNGGGSRRPPAYEYRLGRIKAVVWLNHHPESGPWYSVNVVRSYKDDAGNWKTAHSLGRDDLLPAAECLRQAFIWISIQSSGGGGHTPQSSTSAAQGQSDVASELPI